MKKLVAWALLLILVVVPFINWRVGAVVWLCAWITYVLQMAVSGMQGRKRSLKDD